MSTLDQQQETSLREVFARCAAEVRVPAGGAERLAARDYRPQGHGQALARRTLASAALAAAAAAAVPIAAQAGGPTRTTLKLASYSLRLPARYHEVEAATVSCDPLSLFAFAPHIGVTPPGPTSQPAEPGIVSAADKAGACVSVGMSAPFTPGSPDHIWVATKPSVTQPVDIAGYRGWAGTWTWQGAGLKGGDLMINGVPVANGSTEEVLALTVPGNDGQLQYFAVAATDVTTAQLVSIVTAGLTPPATATTPTTAAPVAATTTAPA